MLGLLDMLSLLDSLSLVSSPSSPPKYSLLGDPSRIASASRKNSRFQRAAMITGLEAVPRKDSSFP